MRAAVALQVLATLAVSVLAIGAAGGSTLAVALQLAAGVVGAVVALIVARFARLDSRMAGLVLLAWVLVIEAWVLVAGVSMEGVRRWLALGPVLLHPASLLVPLAVWSAARRLDAIAAAMLAATLAVLAAQPDAAAVLALTLALGAVAILDQYKRRWAVALTVLGAACAAWAFTRVDPLPAVDHVETVIPNAFAAAPVIGVLAGLAMAALPLAMLWRRRTPQTLALAAAWTGFILANLVANYPAPVIGAGASPVLGWLLSVGLASSRRLLPEGEGGTRAGGVGG
jgi:hypothetical protein